MKKTMIFLFAMIILQMACYSQKKTDSNIYGHVINAKTKEHLPYINIKIEGTTIGTSTDGTGHYFLKNLPIGKYKIVVSSLSYKTEIKDIETYANKSIEIDFELIEDAIQLDNVVISANRIGSSRKESATIVNVISPKIFENTNSVCLSQGLNYQPGLRTEANCQNCGLQQVRINGLDGSYSQILIDSRPIFSSLAGVYGLEQIPSNMIERVEVVRGGGSALFGSNAIAGIVNIITKEPTGSMISVSNTTNVIKGKSFDINTGFNASIVSDNHQAGLIIFGATRQRQPFDYDNDEYSELTKINSKNIGVRGYYNISNYSKVTVEYHNLGEFRRGGNKFDLPAHQANIAEQLDHNINSGGLKYDFYSKNNRHKINVYSSAQQINRKSYYGAGEDLNAYGKTDDISVVSGTQYSYLCEKLIFMPSEIIIGSEVSYNKLTDISLGYGRNFNQTVNTNSIFAQNEWKNKRTNVLLGLRLDKHNLIKHPIFSPRINVRYSPTNNLNLRGSITSGFKAPQTFDEDLHVGTAGGEAIITKIAPNLKPEKSNSYSFSLEYNKIVKTIQIDLLIEGFYTNLYNAFTLREIGNDSDNNKIMERVNSGGAIVKGVNIEGRIMPINKLQMQLGATIQKSEYKKPERWSESIMPQKRMFRTPDNYGFITMAYNFTEKFNIALSGIYTGSMLVQHYAGYVENDTEVITPDFFDLNFKLTYNFIINSQLRLQLNTGIQNLFDSYQKDFDKGESRDAGYFYGPQLPRTFFLGAKVTL